MKSDTEKAQSLRAQSTAAEHRLWQHLRNRQLAGFKFRRQHPIGPFIADLVCPEARLVVEVDGGQHDMQADADRRREAYLAQQGYRVIRFWNNDVLDNTEGVLSVILEALEASGPPDPHPAR